MNEKELREAWTNWIDDVVQEGWNPNRYPHLVPNIADWFIARIKERDEKLKEAIVTMITDAMEEDHKCGGGCGICQWAESVREQILEPVVNLIDNHD